MFLALILPMAAAPLAAVWIDRYPRRLVMMLNDVLTGAVVLCLVFVRDVPDIWIIYAVAAAYGVSQQVFFAARSGLLATWLPADDLGDANGILESIRQALRIVGPLIGAGLYARFGGAATAALDAVTFFASAGFLALLRIPDIVRRDAEERDFRREVVEGALHILRTPELLRLVDVFALALGVIGFLESAVFDLVDRGLGRDAAFVGVTSMVQGFGSVTGGLAAAWALRRFRELPVIGLGA